MEIEIIKEYIPEDNKFSSDPECLKYAGILPEGYKRVGKCSNELALLAKKTLIKAWGTIVEVKEGYKYYLLRVEPHYHFKQGKNGFHKGCTIYIKT